MPGSKKRIALLGSTGSIGAQTIDVVRKNTDKLEIVALAVNSNVDALKNQIQEFSVAHAVVGNDLLKHSTFATLSGKKCQVSFGAKAIVDIVSLPEVDIVVNALVGAAGLEASYHTLKAGKTLALANKESLVVGGDLIMPLATHDTLLPIDSEHGAIYQCLLGEKQEETACLWITASGGPFRGYTPEQLRDITPKQALAHPTWNMGAKISIDSSTLMNKGLEVIEAHHLFGFPYEKIKVVIHPQSVIHSMVEFIDGSVKAHLGTTDMRIPIQFALSYPDRWEAPVVPLDFRKLGSLDFDAPDTTTFRCLPLAEAAGKTGGTLPCVMNAANEVAVARFLDCRCAYLQIPECIEAIMEKHVVQRVESIEQLKEIDTWARDEAVAYLDQT